MSLRILLVEDEPALLLTLSDALRDAGHSVVASASGTQAAASLRQGGIDLLVTDIRLPGMDGCDLANLAIEQIPAVPVVMMTAFGRVDQAVGMMKRGVLDYLTKPVSEAALIRIADAVARAAERGAGPDAPIAVSASMSAVLRMARQVAASPSSVLITGETGVGKEVVARYLHRVSPRAGGAFVAANCGSIPADLVEAELFGHTRGAYTGARDARLGWIRAADRGTLMLDEIGELSPSAQASLLRALEERAVLPIGADRPIPVDFRLVAATHRDLDAAQAAGQFRRDLFFRISAFELAIPPLRDRVEDIPPLVHRFVAALDRSCVVTDEAMATLLAYPWPGNVRELRNAVEHALILAEGNEVGPHHLPARVRARVPSDEPFALRQVLERVEAEHVRRALVLTEGRRQRAAELLGISRKHLWELMRRHGIDAPGE